MAVELITKQDLVEFKQEILQAISGLVGGNQDNREWLKSADVMKMLNISPGTLQNLRINKTLPHTKLGGTYYYPKADVQRLLNSGQQDSI